MLSFTASWMNYQLLDFYFPKALFCRFCDAHLDAGRNEIRNEFFLLALLKSFASQEKDPLCGSDKVDDIFQHEHLANSAKRENLSTVLVEYFALDYDKIDLLGIFIFGKVGISRSLIAEILNWTVCDKKKKYSRKNDVIDIDNAVGNIIIK